MLAYFKVLSSKYSSTTLWYKYSMICTMNYNERNIEIDNYEKLKAFIKCKNTGYVARQAETFDAVGVNTFINDTSDYDYLATKVSLFTFKIQNPCIAS